MSYWLPKIKIWVGVVFIGWPMFSLASPCRSGVGQCDYYKCLSRNLNCSPHDYPLQFGFHYCEKFDKEDSSFSPLGRIFLNKVRSCLQAQLEDDPQVKTCSDAANRAPSHHLKCYIEDNFCALPLKDKVRISETVFAKMATDPRFALTGIEINAHCFP